jgi:hypothetical protein
MKLDTRWLDWPCPEEPAGRDSPPEKSFEAFEASSFSQIENFSPLEADPAAYEATLHEWVLARCVFRDRAWGGIKALHKNYVGWCDQVALDVPAGLATFEKLLREFCSFTTKNGLVYGVLLEEDWESWKRVMESENVVNTQRAKPQKPQN